MAARRGKRQAKRNTSTGTPGWVWLIAIAAVAAVVFMAVPNLFKNDGDGFLRVGPRANPDAVPAPVGDADIDAPASLPRSAAARGEAEQAARPAQPQYDFYTLLPGSEVQMSDAELAATAQAEAERRARAERDAARAAGTTPTGQPAPLPEATAPAPVSEAQRALAALEGRTTPAPVPSAPAPTPLRETRSVSTEAARTPAAPAPAPFSTTSPVAASPAPAAVTTASEPASSVRYLLQAGAFGASAEAEATKARLAMAGLAARVEPAQINGNTVYRVRVGPYGSASELATAKAKLESAGLQAMAIKAQ